MSNDALREALANLVACHEDKNRVGFVDPVRAAEAWVAARAALAQSEAQQSLRWLALDTLRDYVERSTHWEEGGATRHDALMALNALLTQSEPQPSVPEWPCYCDEQKIGEPGVTCGDCPRDYGHKVKQPSVSAEPVACGHDSRILHELAGAASLCWEPKPTGVFDSSKAILFVEEAIKKLRESCASQPPSAPPATQHARKPMTDERIEDEFNKWNYAPGGHVFQQLRLAEQVKQAFIYGGRAIERAHGIQSEGGGVMEAKTPPSAPYVPLSDVQITEIAEQCGYDGAVPTVRLAFQGFKLDAFARAILASRDAELAKLRQGEPVAWDGTEGWEALAWRLCAEENGEEACNELVWEGGPIPEPWGDRWLKYEGEAKRMIALVGKHASPPPAQPTQAEPPAIGMRDDVYADSTPLLNVGNSAFEDWFQSQPFATTAGIKQIARDSYAAGMGDPLVTYAAPPPREPVQPLSDTVSVCKTDANNYCRILTALGMEEEGDPVAEVERLINERAAKEQGS